MYNKESEDRYRKTKAGVLVTIYQNQRYGCKSKLLPMPEYSSMEFRNKFIKDPIFCRFYDKWVESNYDTLKKPSFDRIDVTKGYFFGNLNIVTWKENLDKGRKESILTRGRKVALYKLEPSKPIIFNSLKEACEFLKCCRASLINVCKKHKWHKTIRGYKAEYLEPPRIPYKTRKILRKTKFRALQAKNRTGLNQ